MIRNVLLTCLVAAVKAEADADAYYGAYPYAYGAYPYAYGSYAAAVPFGSSTGLDPITQGLDAVTQGVAVPYAGVYGYGVYGKRDAEADPQVLAYGAALPYAVAAPHAVAATAYGGLVHSSLVGVCTNYLGAQVPC